MPILADGVRKLAIFLKKFAYSGISSSITDIFRLFLNDLRLLFSDFLGSAFRI
jgi:hypothetical protein